MGSKSFVEYDSVKFQNRLLLSINGGFLCQQKPFHRKSEQTKNDSSLDFEKQVKFIEMKAAKTLKFYFDKSLYLVAGIKCDKDKTLSYKLTVRKDKGVKKRLTILSE